MADKDLRIQITTAADTSGADAAAAAMGKVEAATKAADGGGVDISDLTARLDVLRERTKALQENAGATEELAEHTEAVGRKAVSLPAVTAVVGSIGIAANVAGAALREIKEEIAKIDLADIGRIDPAMAQDFANLQRAAEMVEDPLKAIADSIVMMANGESLKDSMAAVAEGFATSQAIFDKMLDHGMVQAQALKALADNLASINAILNATDSANSAARDREDAAKIRGGADPYEIKKQRAADDAAAAIARINRDQEAKEQAAAAAMGNSFQASRNADAIVQNPLSSDIQRAEAVLASETAKADALKASNVALEASRIAEQNRRAIRESSAGKIEGLSAEQDESKAKEEQAAYDRMRRQEARDAAREEAAARKAERERKQQESAGVREANELSALGQSAAGLPEAARQAGARPDYVADLSRRVNTLTTNPSRGAEKELHALVDQLLKYAEGGNAQFQAFHNRLATLERSRKLDSR